MLLLFEMREFKPLEWNIRFKALFTIMRECPMMGKNNVVATFLRSTGNAPVSGRAVAVQTFLL